MERQDDPDDGGGVGMMVYNDCRCEKCGHTWWKRSAAAPAMCPKCKTRDWNKPRPKKEGEA